MLAGLWHHGIVRGHDQNGQVNARGAGQHVLDKALVARHIDDAEAELAQVKNGKTNVNGDAAGFFFGEPVTVDAGKRLHQGSLAVVDVPSCAEDQVAWHESVL